MPTFSSLTSLATLLILQAPATHALANGLALTPPAGFRTWNNFGLDVNQNLMEEVMLAMVQKQYPLPNGTLVSLADIGYTDVGLDDGWEACNTEGKGYHNASGYPIVRSDLFPDFKGMTDYAHSLNLTAGWYGNVCACNDPSNAISHFLGDVQAFVDFGFDSYKLDSCSGQQDIQLWSNLLNATGKKVIIESCHNGPWLPQAPRKPNSQPYCPFHFYRTSTDIMANYSVVFGVNLPTVTPLASQGLSYPGCFAYPDMLEVGVHPGLHKGEVGLTHLEARSHFGAWCIVSSPLVISLDPRNTTIVLANWDILGNIEAIAVNQAWACLEEDGKTIKYGYCGNGNGINQQVPVPIAYSGMRILQAPPNETVTWEYCGLYTNCSAPTWEIYAKPLLNGSAAVLILNHGDNTLGSVQFSFSDIPGLQCGGGVDSIDFDATTTAAAASKSSLTSSSLLSSSSSSCAVRDIWNHQDLGVFTGGYQVTNLVSHDSVFLIVSTP